VDQPETLLSSLQADLNYYADYLHGMANEVLNSGLSKYPIFIAHQMPIGMGRMLLDHTQLNTQWSISISLLEEFVGRNVVTKDKLFSFRQQFKDPENFMCVFMLAADGTTRFVYLPYGDDSNNGLDEVMGFE